MKLTYHVGTTLRWIMVAAGIALGTGDGLAVTSKVHRHEAGPDLFNGQTDNTVIGSRGTLGLGRSVEVLAETFSDVWSINSIVTDGSTLYFGTSPNGGIYRYASGQLTRLYPDEETPASPGPQEPLADSNDPRAYDRISNEHVFAMTLDIAGRMVAGISGATCRLLRFSTEGRETLFEPNDAKYIFALTTDTAGNIYVGTGPQGKVYRLDPFGKTAQLLYDSQDKNMLSLAAGTDGFIYAGSDSRGLVYKLNPRTQDAVVLYDSSQPEITALLFSDEAFLNQRDLYAIGTAANVLKTETEFAAQVPMPGRPERSEEEPPDSEVSAEGMRLQVANTKEPPEQPQPQKPAPITKGQRPDSPSYLYHIDANGYVKALARESVIFFCLTHMEEQLLVGTGNKGQLLSIDPDLEEKTILYEDKTSSQITSLAAVDREIYMGLANPAKLIKLSALYASAGTYTSSLIDAGQPAHWGKLQIEGDIPKECKVFMESRCGNVEDVNDPLFSPWSDPVEVVEPVPLSCPVGRFCQYRLTLKSQDGKQTPLIREVVVASTIPNLPPVVEAVDVERISASPKGSFYKIKYRTTDHNDDQLIYTIHFRKVGRTPWIEMADQVETDSYDWNSLTVEDGRYEIRVLASDERSNSPATKMTGSRISDPVVVDNTGPVIREHFIERRDHATTLILLVKDAFSVINKLMYTVDGHKEWKGAVPDDLVYDTTDESFTITLEDLDPGEHVVAIQVSDDVGNMTYQSFEVNEPEH